MNVLWICTDQQRYDTIASLGNSNLRTPAIDQLVSQGVAFTHAFCQSPVCTPSRASFLTGRYPRTTRCRQNGQTLPADEKLISKRFSEAGYVCGLAGKLHLASCSDGKVEHRGDDGYSFWKWSHHPQPDWPENAYTQWLADQGVSWEELLTDEGDGYVQEGVPARLHQTTWCADMAIEFMTKNRKRPWFFSFNCFDPHHPFDPPPEYRRRIAVERMPLPKLGPRQTAPTSYQELDRVWAHNDEGGFHAAAMTDDDRRRVTAAYYAMIELIDDQVARMLQTLDDTGQRERTLVVFMSDHGEMLGDHGLYYKGPHFYEAAIRVPLVLSWPERFERNWRVDGLVELVDLAPTLMEAAGLEAPACMQGRSLMAHCLGRADPTHHREYVFSEYYNSWTHPRSYGSMMRTTTEKIAVYHGVNFGEVYDLEDDPAEFRNLWNDPGQLGRRDRLMKACFDASIFTMDPEPPRLGAF